MKIQHVGTALLGAVFLATGCTSDVSELSGPEVPTQPQFAATSTQSTFLLDVITPGYEMELFFDGVEVPNDLAFDPTGGLLVSETGASRVSQIEVLPDGSPGDAVVIASGINDAEGLALSDDVLYVSNSDIVYRVADGVTTPFADGFLDAEGLAIDANGDLYVADDGHIGNPRITKVEVLPDGTAGAVTELLIVPEGTAADIDFGPTGDLFIADGAATVWVVRFAADGSVTSLEIFANVPSPFSLAFASSGELFVGTTGGAIWSIEPGEPPSLFASGLGSVEGLAFDTAGRLYLSLAFAGQIWRITMAVHVVDIDIKPGSYPNSINAGSQGGIPVAIFSSPTFDATTVDPATVELGGAEVCVVGKGKSMVASEDVNGDGLTDLILQVETSAFEVTDGDVEAFLTGQTFDGTHIRGVDTIRIVPPGDGGI